MEFLKIVHAETPFLLLDKDEVETGQAAVSRLQAQLDAGETNIFVAKVAGSIIGFLASRRGAYRKNKHSLYLAMGVLTEEQGKGVGKSLLESIEVFARESGITRLELTTLVTNQAALKLYTKCGFEIEGTKRRALLLGGEYVDEYYMAKLLT